MTEVLDSEVREAPVTGFSELPSETAVRAVHVNQEEHHLMNATSTAADLAALYGRFSARLAAHAAERLVAAGVGPVGEVDDLTQEVWLWAAQQRRLPGWEGLQVMTDWVIEAAINEQQARLEVPVGLRPSGTPVVPWPAIENVRLVGAESTEVPEDVPLAA